MDFSVLSPPAQRELAQIFTDEFCYCGCPHTLGACLKQHGGCKHAKRMANLAAAESAAGTPSVESILMLSRYYGSFGQKRHGFKPDERMCLGQKEAKVTLVEFADFECPACAQVRPALEAFAQSRPEVRLCYLPFPLSAHPNGMRAGQAAFWAREKGKFWQMHDLMFEHQSDLGPQSLARLAQKLGLSAEELSRELESKKYLDELNASREAGVAAGVDGTPSLFLNGRKLDLPLTPEMLGHTVEDELEWMKQGNSWAAD